MIKTGGLAAALCACALLGVALTLGWKAIFFAVVAVLAFVAFCASA